MEIKTFNLRTVLTCTTGRLLTKPKSSKNNGIENLYELLNWMTGDNLYTHQLGRASKQCAPFLLKLFPDLKTFSEEKWLNRLDSLLSYKKDSDVIEEWISEVIFNTNCCVNDNYEIYQIPNGEYNQIDPMKELIDMRGGGGIIPVVV